MNKELKKIDKMDVKVILDNGGGAILVVSGQYQHTYDSMEKLAEDLLFLAINGESSVNEWDGNELCICDDQSWTENTENYNGCPECNGHEELDPTINDISSGGYRVLSYLTEMCPNNIEDCWGGNGRDLRKALLKI